MNGHISERLKQLYELFPEAFDTAGKLNIEEFTRSLGKDAISSKANEPYPFDNNMDMMIFEQNPLPCFILEYETSKILHVNCAALEIYGYSYAEFILLNFKAIRPKEDIPLMLKGINNENEQSEPEVIVNHIKKDGKVLCVEESSFTISYKGHKARYTQIKDISKRIELENEIKEQDKWLIESQRIGEIGSYSLDIPNGEFTSSVTLDEILGLTKPNPKRVDDWINVIHPDDREMMIKYLNKDVIENNNRFNKEYRIIRKNGDTIWVSGLGLLCYDRDGNLEKMVGTIQNITQRKQLELEKEKAVEKRRKSEDQHKEAQKIAKIGHWEHFFNTNTIEWSAELYHIYEQDQSIFTPTITTVFECIHPEDIERVKNSYLQSTKRKVEFGTDFRIVLKSGITKHIHLQSKTIFDDNNVAIRSYGTMQDITARKLAEEESLKSYKLYQAILRVSPDMTVVSNMSGEVIMVSENVYSTLGIDSNLDLSGNIIFDFLIPEDRDKARFIINQRIEGKFTGVVEYRIMREDKSILYIEVNSDIIRDTNGIPTQIMLVIRDISERKKIEHDKNIINERYIDLFENAPIGYFEIDINGKILNVNQTIVELSGHTKEELIGNFCWDYTANSQLVKKETLAKLQGEDLPMESYDREIIRKDGTKVAAYIKDKLLKNESGEIIGIRSNAQDISELKRIENTLKESESHFRSITETSVDAIITINSKGAIEYLNQSTENMFGFAYEDLIHLPITRIIPKTYLSKYISNIHRLSEFDNTHISGDKSELYCRKKDGGTIPVEISFSKWDLKGMPYTTIIIHDISQRKQLEKQYQILFSEMLDGFALGELITDDSGKAMDFKFVAVNEVYGKLIGLKPDEIIGKTITEIKTLDIGKRFAIYEKVIKTGKPTTFEESNFIEGKHFHFTVYSPSKNMVAAIISDITARKEAEKILKESQESLALKVKERTEALEKISIFNKTIIDHADIAIISTDRSGTIVSINPFAERLLGYTKEEAIGKSALLDIFKEKELRESNGISEFSFLQLTKKILTKKVVEETIIKDRYGRLIPVLISYNILRNKSGRVDGFVLVSTDITTLKSTEESLLRSRKELMIRESYLLAMVENHPGRFWMKDKTGKYILSNERNNKFIRLTSGYVRDIIGANDNEIFSLQSARNFRKIDLEIIKSKKPIIKEIDQIVGARLFTFERHNFPVIAQDGEVIGVAGFANDITERKNQEAQLKMQSEAFESFSLSLVISDINGTILWANQAFERLTGYSPKEAIGKRTSLLKSGLHPDEYFVNLWSTIKSGKVWNGEFINRKKDGTLYYEESTITPVRNEKGEITKFVAIKIDITHRREIEKALKFSEERWQFAIDASGDGVWDYNYQTDIEFYSKQWKEMLGYNEEEISTDKMEWEARVHPEDIKQCRADMLKHIEGVSPFYINEHRILCKDGTYKWVLSRGKLIERDANGDPLRIIGTQTDISEIKRLEETLKQNIEREKELNEMKSRFVSTASHEFRTPLASILITTDSLINYWSRMGEEQIFSKFEKIRSNVVHLNNIVSDVLQISKIQEGKIEIKPIKLDIILLCREIVDGFRDENKKYTIQIQTVFDSFFMYLDERLIRQALNNLISNALKYSPNANRVDIIINHTLEEISISVIDQGIGIPESDQKNLFTPFYRATNTRNIQGNGLGLNIIRESVKLHGGEITFKSTENKGSNFTIHLPIRMSLLKPNNE